MHIARPANRTTRYAYDATGNITTVAHNDEAPTTYTYRPDGALVEVSTPDSTVRLTRDALGNILREEQNGITIDSSYDLLGQRTGL